METRIHLKMQAIALRKQGLSYNEIRQKVPVAKSTLSLWLKTILIKKEYRERLYTKQIRNLEQGAQSQKERRVREIQRILDSAKREITYPLPINAYKLFGAALYWAEGTKGNGLEVTNSDPNLILFMVRWFEKIFKIKPEILRVQLNMYHQQNEKFIKRFWSELCGIPLENFGKSYFKPANKGYKKNNLYYGTVKIRVPCGTDIRWRMFGWVQKVLEETNPHLTQIERRWERLKKVRRAVNLT